MPAEWDLHERTLLTWPTRRELWAGVFEDAKREYAEVARTIADFEPVTVIALPGTKQEVIDHCGTANLDILEAPVDDSWIRDNGPLVVRDSSGHRLGVDFAFNSWGRKFLPYDQDASLTPLILKHLGIERVGVDLVLEGGSISVDGEGTLISTAQCLLHSNRNPGLSQATIEDTVKRALGIDTVLLLPFGHLDDRHTDGHVDGVCTYVAPGRVVAQTCSNTANINHEAMSRNLRYLRDTTDREGRTVEVLGLDLFSSFDVEGVTDYVSYPNFYVANGVVVVPVSGNAADDERALSVISAQFPDRQTIGVTGRVIAFGGGGPHCITMQIPAGG
ncbi:agmatine deiminase family protein [Kribbella antibiotica]|uniref:Agmatine deiminase family protein n=2 Tax=Kribbella antibiotica TaxID=190195 RepID=A0A4R4ZVV5_9ACTN|nr:agmatine deiminase family protein [Kribbella antibiotica]